MQWTVRLEARTDKGEGKTTELVTFRRPAMASTLAEIGLTLAEAKALLTKLQASILCDQLAEYAAHRRVCPDCGMLQPLKDRRTRRLQTLFGTVEIEAPRFRVCRCRRPAPRALPHFWWSSRPAGCSNILECRAFVDFSRRPDRELAAGGRAAQNCVCFQRDYSSRTNSFPPKVRESHATGGSPHESTA